MTNKDGTNQYNKEVEGQNELQPKSTAEVIGKQHGVSESTVKRAKKFVDGL